MAEQQDTVQPSSVSSYLIQIFPFSFSFSHFQPYLKEILKEICNYNAKNPHKNMWELKPEFRHYNSSSSKAED